jgi:Zn-dependent peptidase ImmA (M78 family)
VSRRFHEMRRDRGKFLPADLCLLASYFRVSIEAMARRLEEIQLIRAGKYDSMLANGFRPNEAREQLGLVSDFPEEHALPLRYRYLATEAFAQGTVTEVDFVHYLRTDLARARKIFQSLRMRPVTTASGEEGAIEMSLTENMGA